jgi:DNA-binding NarL/FixJ family response regulator
MRILVADDHALLTDTLAMQANGLAPDLTIETVADLPSVLAHAEGEQLALIVLDLYMPGMNGLGGLAALRRKFPKVPVALMSGEISSTTMETARAAGAVGFIPKTIRLKDMLAAIRAMASGEQFFPPADGARPLVAGGDETSPGGRGVFSSLTKRELQVLHELCKGASNIEIGKALSLEPVTVGLYLRTIYRKLDVQSRVQAVKLSLESGLDI